MFTFSVSSAFVMAAVKRGILNLPFNYQSLSRINARNISSQLNLKAVDFVGRDVISPVGLSEADVKALLWTAVEMKAMRRPCSLLSSRHVSLVLVKPSAKCQLAFERAAGDLGASFTSYVHPDWGDQPDIGDSGRLLSSLTDAVVVYGLRQLDVEHLADGSRVPVVNACSEMFSLCKALADLLTLLEALLGPLRRRCLAWVGPPAPLCNAYLCLAPKLGLNLRVFCICPKGKGLMSAANLELGFSLCHGQAELHECASVQEAVHRADVIATAKHSVPQHCITLKGLAEADLNWRLLHALPRTPTEVSDQVFRHNNNLTWQSVENTRYVAMALLLRVLRKHELSTPMPDFDGPP